MITGNPAVGKTQMHGPIFQTREFLNSDRASIIRNVWVTSM